MLLKAKNLLGGFYWPWFAFLGSPTSGIPDVSASAPLTSQAPENGATMDAEHASLH